MKNTDHRSADLATSPEQPLSDLLPMIDQLSIDAKAALITHLLGNSGFDVRFDRHYSSLIAQINTMDQAALGDVLQAIAVRIQSN